MQMKEDRRSGLLYLVANDPSIRLPQFAGSHLYRVLRQQEPDWTEECRCSIRMVIKLYPSLQILSEQDMLLTCSQENLLLKDY